MFLHTHTYITISGLGGVYFSLYGELGCRFSPKYHLFIALTGLFCSPPTTTTTTPMLSASPAATETSRKEAALASQNKGWSSMIIITSSIGLNHSITDSGYPAASEAQFSHTPKRPHVYIYTYSISSPLVLIHWSLGWLIGWLAA